MCIFCKIVQKEIPARIVYEDEAILAFDDVNPIAPVHVLVIPKRHIESVNELSESPEDERLAGRIILTAKEIAQRIGIAGGGYKLLLRVGRDGGQEVQHIHLHLLGGGRLGEDIYLAE